MKLLRRTCRRRFASIAALPARAARRKRRGTIRFWARRIFARRSGSLRLFICGGNWKSIIGTCRRRRRKSGFIGRVCRRSFGNWESKGPENRGTRGRGRGAVSRGDDRLLADFRAAVREKYSG